MKCPVCGGAELVHDTREINANGLLVVVTGDFCPACREGVLNRENGDRYGAALKRGKLLVDDRCQIRNTVETTPPLSE